MHLHTAHIDTGVAVPVVTPLWNRTICPIMRDLLDFGIERTRHRKGYICRKECRVTYRKL